MPTSPINTCKMSWIAKIRKIGIKSGSNSLFIVLLLVSGKLSWRPHAVSVPSRHHAVSRPPATRPRLHPPAPPPPTGAGPAPPTATSPSSTASSCPAGAASPPSSHAPPASRGAQCRGDGGGGKQPWATGRRP